MSTGPRSNSLTTVQFYNLNRACEVIDQAFGKPPYLVGTATSGEAFRDVDVRLLLDDADFAATCPTRERWELLCLAISTWLAERTGLPIDFQIQRIAEANEKHAKGRRNALGMRSSVFAAGGDGTPPWTPAPVAKYGICPTCGTPLEVWAETANEHVYCPKCEGAA